MTAKESTPVEHQPHALAQPFPNHRRRNRISGKNRPAGIRLRLKTENSPDPGALWISQKPAHDLGNGIKVPGSHGAVMRELEGQAGALPQVEGKLGEPFPHRMKISFTR